ncbi:hypothetical protein D3Z60_09255 [Lachnospiraceae bacterium]|jgi:hypothetical protein|nr:hypothetical protein [Lachnospiraceae bacterium]
MPQNIISRAIDCPADGIYDGLFNFYRSHKTWPAQKQTGCREICSGRISEWMYHYENIYKARRETVS